MRHKAKMVKGVGHWWLRENPSASRVGHGDLSSQGQPTSWENYETIEYSESAHLGAGSFCP
jgi:hypothetical protein